MRYASVLVDLRNTAGLFADAMSDATGMTVSVVNCSGPNGAVGTESVGHLAGVRLGPDGGFMNVQVQAPDATNNLRNLLADVIETYFVSGSAYLDNASYCAAGRPCNREAGALTQSAGDL